MDDVSKSFAPELSPAASKRWIGRLIIAVVMGAAIWNFVVALTVSLVVPGLARVMEADPQSALYLGKGDINFAALFIALLELCFATIAVLAVNALSNRRPRPVRKKPAVVTLSAPPVAPAITAAAPQAPTTPRPPAPFVELAREATPPTPMPVAPQTIETAAVAAAQPVSPQAPAPLKSAKSTKPKKVYYNSVGDLVEEDE